MTIKVIETTTQQRTEEIHQLFEKIKPLLNQGESYSSATAKIKNKRDINTNRAWFKDLIKYGEEQGYLYRNYRHKKRKLRKPKKNKTGLFRVKLETNKNTANGYIWKYVYYKNKKAIVISSVDLIKLEKKVENKNLTWKIIDAQKAKKSYQKNQKMNKNKSHPQNTSGVNRVSKHNKGGWRYTYQKNNIIKKTFCRKNPQDLKQAILNANLEWKIVNRENAQKNNLL